MDVFGGARFIPRDDEVVVILLDGHEVSEGLAVVEMVFYVFFVFLTFHYALEDLTSRDRLEVVFVFEVGDQGT